MTSRTTRQHVFRLDVVFLSQFTAYDILVARRLPFHVRDVFLFPQNLFRRAVTFETPLHLQRSFVPDAGHQVNSTVTGRTTYAFVDVDAVIEIGEIRQVVYARPLDRLFFIPTRAHDFQVLGIGK